MRKRLQLLITTLFDKSFDIVNVSEKLYSQAQNLLLSELGLTKWKPKHRLSFIKNYSDTRHANRMDAEYFQPKYDELVRKIWSCPGGWDRLGNLVLACKCIKVGSEEYIDKGVPFVRVSNLNPFEITEEKCISEELYKELKGYQPQKDEILFSKDATPGIAYHLNEEPQKMIPSSGILRLRNKTKRVNNEYLTLVLNSILTKEQISRDVGGSVILHWRPEQIKETIIPILPREKQNQIKQKVSKSLALRKQAKQLLEIAKMGVEIAIEKSEKTAMEWMEAETKKSTK